MPSGSVPTDGQIASYVGNYIHIQAGTHSFAATSATWQYKSIAFDTVYTRSPLITVMPSSTGGAPNGDIMIDQRSATGFRMGRYSASAGEYLWTAIGMKA